MLTAKNKRISLQLAVIEADNTVAVVSKVSSQLALSGVAEQQEEGKLLETESLESFLLSNYINAR